MVEGHQGSRRWSSTLGSVPPQGGENVGGPGTGPQAATPDQLRRRERVMEQRLRRSRALLVRPAAAMAVGTAWLQSGKRLVSALIQHLFLS
jgi:hypothetical protein